MRVEVPGESRRCISGWGVQFPQGPGSGWVFSPRLGIYCGKNALFTSVSAGAPAASAAASSAQEAYLKWHYDVVPPTASTRGSRTRSAM